MPEPWHPHSGQKKMLKFLLEHAVAALLCDPGIGKTATTYAAFKILKKRRLASKMLVIAPLRPAQLVWKQEADKWSDFAGLRVELLHGKDKGEALYRDADVYVINPDGLDWLLETKRSTTLSGKVHIACDVKAFKKHGFDVLVIDELTQFKNTNAGRFKALKSVRETFSRIYGLTGTPVPNGLLDIFGQMLILDGGRTFGPYVTHYRRNYFLPGYDGYSWVLQKGAEERIYERLRPIALRLESKDFVDMPALVENMIRFDLPPDVRKFYDRLEEEFIAQVGDSTVIAPNAAAASTKLRQSVSGGVYIDDCPTLPKAKVIRTGGRPWAALHDLKTDLLEELVEGLQGTPLLTYFDFHHDAARIKKRFPDAVDFTGVSGRRAVEIEAAWNRGEIPLLMGHPQCLHPETLVLTEFRGWVMIKDVEVSDRVFDGHEFVYHDGCVLSGVKSTIQKFGITCTSDHLFYVGGTWIEAKDVPDSENSFRKACYVYAGDDVRISTLLSLRSRKGDLKAERCPQQSYKTCPLPQLRLSSDDKYSPIPHLARNADAGIRSKISRLPKLWGARDYLRPKVAALRKFLARYAAGLFRGINHRADSQRKRLFSRKLLLGNAHAAAIEQTLKSYGTLPRSVDAFSRFLSLSWGKPRCYNSISKSGSVWRRRYSSLSEINVPTKAKKPEEVFDIVNCGPRRRFVVRNSNGDMFIVHNSIGHGLNLQHAGNHVCWYSLPWARDLFDQGNGRVRRQGSKHQTVFVHFLVARNTIDEIVYRALVGKAKVQDALLAALKGRR